MPQKELKGRLLTRIWNDFYDPKKPGSFSGLSTFKRHSASAKSLKHSTVKRFLLEQDAYTLHYPRRKNYKRNKIISPGKDYLWQADLVDISALSKFNYNIKYLLTVVDVFSKYAWVIVLKNKSSSAMVEAFERIFKERKPMKISSDAGKEFTNKDVQKLLQDNGISFYVAPSADVKAAIAERFNRTLKQRMWRYFTARNTFKYYDVLDNLVASYNKTYHRAIGMPPSKVTIDNQKEVYRKLYNKEWPRSTDMGRIRFKFNVGDVVKLSRVKRLFEKGYVSNWTKENFIVCERRGRYPPVYKVKDENGEIIKGVFYEAELLKVGK